MSVEVQEVARATVATVATVATPRRASWARLRARLWPLEGGRGAIPALDGLRALAALSVLVYHATSISGAKLVIAGHDLGWTYFYLESGVDLFFVLSGFLLFLPYARAILDRKSGPRPLTFFRRRALRILPAYYGCLGIIALAETLLGNGPDGWNMLAHIFFFHDYWGAFNRTISGPFWTLAVEWQFYLLLPWIAWLIARVSAGKPWRLALGTSGVIAGALAVRYGAAGLVIHLGAQANTPGAPVNVLLTIFIGAQGKFFEVFGVGMLCAVGYLVAVERGGLSAGRAWWVGLALLALALAVYLAFGPEVFIRRNAILAAYPGEFNPADTAMMLGPLALGLGYGALLLGILLGPGAARALFSWAPLRFVGYVSYSLYLWHEAVLNTVYPWLRSPTAPAWLNVSAALATGLVVAIPFAYLMYQLIERSFLKMR